MNRRRTDRDGPGAAARAGHADRAPGPASRGAIVAALAVALLALLLHARSYAFLTDDAYISFRYAWNLSHGHGLVFNPGSERVEGYSNFLWVVVLAGLDRLGIPPEHAANPLGFALTVVLVAAVCAYAWRERPPGRSAWWVVFPAIALAATRSVAVWTTGGLETRLFEVLIVGGILRLLIEIDSLIAAAAPPRGSGAHAATQEPTASGRRVRILSPWLFALAALTRPDGVLLSGCAFLGGAAVLLRARRAALRRFAIGWIPFIVLVGGHLAFRRVYYGEWVPNTYFAKVGGRLDWASGLRYLAAFVLEYALWLWVPLVALAVIRYRARNRVWVPALIGAILLPHLLYVVAIGGDHFEFRPLDLEFPLLFLLACEGARRWAEARRAAPVLAGYLALALIGLIEIPRQSHLQFPGGYMSGFPGPVQAGLPGASGFLSADRDPIYRLPGLRALASAHRSLLGTLTGHFVGIRQEEHRLFLQTTVAEGRRIGDMIRRGMLPRDVRLAVDCVGAIPYLSGAWTLDRLGLTDAHVAHSPFVRDVMAHGKQATPEYARERGVDLWAVDAVHLVIPVTAPNLIATVDGLHQRLRQGVPAESLMAHPVYAADVGEGGLLVAQLPQGLERASRRMPRLRFESITDTVFLSRFERLAKQNERPGVSNR